jgi:hypothetical protein
VRDRRFVGFGHATLRTPQLIPLPPPPLKNPEQAGKIADVVHAVQAHYRGEVYLGWDWGRYSVAVWHQGQWLCAALGETADDTLRSLAASDAEGAMQQRVQRLEDTLIQRAGSHSPKRLTGWGRCEIDRSSLQEVESQVLAVLQGLGIVFADVTVTVQGKLSLAADGTSAESVFCEEVVDTVASLLRSWVRTKAGSGQKVRLFHDARAAHKTLERLERALGLAAGSRTLPPSQTSEGQLCTRTSTSSGWRKNWWQGSIPRSRRTPMASGAIEHGSSSAVMVVSAHGR